MDISEFVIANVVPRKLNELVKKLMDQMGINDPNEAIRCFNTGEWVVVKKGVASATVYEEPLLTTYFEQLHALEQQAILRLKEIEDSGPTGRKQAEQMWSSLSQELKARDYRVTKPLIKLLKFEFDRLNWGVKCLKKNCALPASLLWMKQLACAEGGVLAFSHYTDDGNRVIHCGRTTLPLKIAIIEKVDRRKATSRV